MQLGILLPHFGPHASYERLIDYSPRLEQLGFASVWVRDNLGFTGGHAFEARGDTFVDPFITLAAIAARTERISVGTGTIIPIRPHPITAQLVGSLAFIARNRLILGVGAGNVPKAFEIVGVPYDQRMELVREMVGVLRAVAHPPASFSGPTTSFEDATIQPAPPADLEIWYGGSTFQSVERAIEYCTGWLPGRCPLAILDDKLVRLRERSSAEKKTMKVGIIPVVSIDKDRETALRKVNVSGLLAEARERTAWAKAGPFESADDLEGLLLAGTSSDIVADLQKLDERGVDHVVLDFRLRMDQYEECVEQVAQEVLPGFLSIVA